MVSYRILCIVHCNIKRLSRCSRWTLLEEEQRQSSLADGAPPELLSAAVSC